MKKLIIHADDAGLSQAHNEATLRAVEEGVCTSYSIMMPCAWAYDMVRIANAHPHHDAGIHLTLTCEWHNYRFGPVAGAGSVPSLVDEYGHFFRTRDQLAEYAASEEVEIELRAQINYALKLGLQPTHLDSHMYSVGARQDFLDIYRRLGREFGLPVQLSQGLLRHVRNNHQRIVPLGSETLVDHVHLATFAQFQRRGIVAHYRSVLKNLPNGLNILLVHPAINSAEMRAITVDHPNFGAAWREIDHDFLLSAASHSLITELGIELMDWRSISAG
ncbi:polysaccharide deacetylase family protein [Neolewinella antarctica]|uniref:ChbG/HpnK family deacetylase n=1 Tax=Neolewinella antarctica TaxID=442734 RepID=A0ABX0X855_9BACT|nr:polysaccharide deacetylase family protein [Neolewinella antarctica]NJC25426.1 hypothetical protein [Neolewinella antarctica]